MQRRLHLRGAWLRFYPTFLTLTMLAQRALALECQAVDQQGEPAPAGALVETHQALELAIHDQVAAAHATYRFENHHTTPLELTCELRLGAREMVDGFSYWNGSEQVVGEVLERSSAAAVYDDLAQVQRKDPGLLEQDGDLFRFRVFPIEPGEEKRVELRSVVPLPLRDGAIEYVIPRANLPRSGGFTLAAQISDELKVSGVELRGAAKDTKRTKLQQLDTTRVALRHSTDRVSAEDDLVLRYRVQSEDYGLRLLGHRGAGGDGTFMLIVSPKAVVGDDEVIGRDIVFVTDISGSMAGAPLEQAKLGLSDMLERLAPADRFDVVSFDDESYPMFGKLVPVADASRDDALGRVAALATQGGTDIHGALLRALELLKDEQPGRARAIVFLTDGQGDTPPEVVAADVRARSQGVRIYSFGVGEGVNRGFLQRLADENRGVASFVTSNARIHEEMRRLYERIAMPLMMDLELEVEGGDVHSVYPKQLPDLYRDGEVIVLGRYKRAGSATLRVRGRLKGGAKQLALAAELPAAEPRFAHLEKLWASQRVSHLLASMGENTEEPELVREVTRLGIVYNLVTPYTAFLAVPASLQTAEIKQQLRRGQLGYDKKLVDSMQGIELSQTAIPPGDPVLSVIAPGDAQQVVAYFPFGLTKRLAWDARRKHWYARFLVPRDVADGAYTIRVRIVHADGTAEWKEIEYTIDGSAPELDVVADEFAIPGVRFHIAVDPLEPVREVYAYARQAPGVSKKRARLKLNPETGFYEGDLPMPDALDGGEITVRIVARDAARNRVEEDVRVPVLSDVCCEDEETCGLPPDAASPAPTGADS